MTQRRANINVLSAAAVVQTYNALTLGTGNLIQGASNNVPSEFFDFESILLHEMGHCRGLQQAVWSKFG